MLQEAGVAIVVLAAVAFLIRQFAGGSRRPKKKATTFVPLAQLKKKPDDSCH